jgi:hypothetical protein
MVLKVSVPFKQTDELDAGCAVILGSGTTVRKAVVDVALAQPLPEALIKHLYSQVPLAVIPKMVNELVP